MCDNAVLQGDVAKLTQLLAQCGENIPQFLSTCVDCVSEHENEIAAMWLFDALTNSGLRSYVMCADATNPFFAKSAWLVARYFAYTRGRPQPSVSDDHWVFAPIEAYRADIMAELFATTNGEYLRLVLDNEDSIDYMLIAYYAEKNDRAADIFQLLSGVLNEGDYLGG